MKLSYRLASILTALLLTASGEGFARPVSGNEEVPAEFSFLDQRPANEKKTKMLSTWITSCGFGIMNLGENRGFGVNRIADLKSALSAKRGTSAIASSVVLKSYRVSLNGHAFQTGDSLQVAFGGGAIAPLIDDGKARKAKCGRDKTPQGWFDPHEITNSFSPIVVEIDFAVNGNQISIRKVGSQRREMAGPLGLDTTTFADLDEILGVMNQANQFAAEAYAKSASTQAK